MLTQKEVYTLASRPERAENSVLTLYLDVDQSQQANLNRGFEKQLKDMLTAVKDGIRDEGELKTFQTASKLVEGILAGYAVDARGLVVVADASDGFFWSRGVDFPVGNQIRWNKKVHVQPLAAALDEYEQVGIVLLDRASVRLFTLFLGKVEEYLREDFDHRSVRHTKTIGMDHLGSASRAQRKGDEQVRQNLRRVVTDIDAMVDKRGIQHLILAGASELTAELRALLSKRLDSLVIGTVDMATSAGTDEIYNAVTPICEKFERDSEEATVTDLVTLAAKSDGVVIGLSQTLHALNQYRVWRLVCADGFQSPGYQCTQCAALFPLDTICSVCGSEVTAIQDVVENGVDLAVRRGARIEFVRGNEAESSLMNAGGIGAFLRTRTPKTRVS